MEIYSGETRVDEIEGLGAGLTKELKVTLEAGAYTFVCKLNGHDQLGMKGTLTVKSERRRALAIAPAASATRARSPGGGRSRASRPR